MGVGLISSARRRSAGGGVDTLADLFANGEIGDWWRFDADNTDANVAGDTISVATGMVNGRLLEDADASHLPNLELFATSGFLGARFNGGGGSSERLVHAFGSTVAQPGTIVLALTGGDTSTHVMCTGSSSSSRWQINNDSGGNIVSFATNTSFDSTLNEPVGTKVLRLTVNGASSKWHSNGALLATGNPGTGGTNQLTIGSLWDGTFAGNFLLMDALFINRELTAGEAARVDTLFGSHLGLSL